MRACVRVNCNEMVKAGIVDRETQKASKRKQQQKRKKKKKKNEKNEKKNIVPAPKCGFARALRCWHVATCGCGGSYVRCRKH